MSFASDTGSGTMGSGRTRTITAFFDSRTDAEEAVARLVSAGISRESVRIVEGGQGSGGGASVSTSSYGESGSGFWDALKDLFLPDEDRQTYAEGLRRGGYLVTVNAPDAYYEQAIDILDDEGTVDIDERASSWRSEGWSGYSGETSTGSFGRSTGSSFGGSTGSSSAGTGSLGTTGSSFAGDSASTEYSGTTSDRVGTGEQEVIPMAEEELRVAKRDVNHGRVRVRSYVVETPVTEDVNLREERVHIERRPVGDTASTVGTGDAGLFQERTIDVEERSEEAVVAKEARVVEEVVVRKEAEERVQTVQDTVRRTEVEVEDDRRAAGATTGPTTTRSTTTGTTRAPDPDRR